MRHTVEFRTTLLAFVSGSLLATVTSTAQAAIALGDTVNLYGFLKFDGTYQSETMNSEVAPRFVKADGPAQSNFTAMHSRIGLKWKGPEVYAGYSVSGHLEFDLFDSASSNQMKVRDRIVAFSLSNGTSTWLFGQQWDIFSPLGPTTFMTNGYLWQTGNLGFRRSQIRYTHTSDVIDYSFSLNDPNTNSDTDSTYPVAEANAWWKFGNGGKVALSGTIGTVETKGTGKNDDIQGLSLSAKYPFADRFSFLGEIAAGENLNMFLSRSSLEQDVISGWGEIVYNGPQYKAWIGYAQENVDDVSVSSAIEDTRTVFAAVGMKLGKPVFIGLEYAYFKSDFKGQNASGDSDVDANQVILSASYSF